MKLKTIYKNARLEVLHKNYDGLHKNKTKKQLLDFEHNIVNFTLLSMKTSGFPSALLYLQSSVSRYEWNGCNFNWDDFFFLDFPTLGEFLLFHKIRELKE